MGDRFGAPSHNTRKTVSVFGCFLFSKKEVFCMNSKTKKLTMLAMLCALAYAAVALLRIPVVLFLKYEPKDVVLTIGGFLFGPLASFCLSALVSLVEMLTLSDTGLIGFAMNLLASCSFACTAAWIYKKHHTLKGAVLGLCSGTVAMTALMILWNYLITPIYMGYPREAVAALLLPAFLPFNLLKGGLNTALTLLIYKPVVRALRRANLIEPQKEAAPQIARSRKIGLTLISLLLLLTCIFFVLVLKGVL